MVGCRRIGPTDACNWFVTPKAGYLHHSKPGVTGRGTGNGADTCILCAVLDEVANAPEAKLISPFTVNLSETMKALSCSSVSVSTNPASMACICCLNKYSHSVSSSVLVIFPWGFCGQCPSIEAMLLFLNRYFSVAVFELSVDICPPNPTGLKRGIPSPASVAVPSPTSTSTW